MLATRAINRATLARQMLLARESLRASEALERLVGMQAQAPNAPYTGLWTRLHDFAHAELATLITERRAVRIALMRSTIHLVTTRDCLDLRPIFQPTIDRSAFGAYGRVLSDMDPAELAAAGRKVLEDGPLTFSELGTRLREHWPDRDARALAHAIRALVPLVQVPPRGVWGAGGLAKHTIAEAWLGRPFSGRPRIERVVLRYLAAFGPASVRDVQVWSGLRGLSGIVDRLRPKLRTFRTEGGVELFDLPDAPRPDPEVPAPVRFLPDFDNVLLSYADRARIVPERHRRVIYSTNGIIYSTLLLDGFVRGICSVARGRRSATLVIRQLDRLSRPERVTTAEEGLRLLAFLAADRPEHDVTFTT